MSDGNWLSALGILLLLLSLAATVLWLLTPARKRSAAPSRTRALPGRWEVREAYDGFDLIGYQVLWSVPLDNQEYLCVGHYYAGREISLNWCHGTAVRDAIELNSKGKTPADFSKARLEVSVGRQKF